MILHRLSQVKPALIALGALSAATYLAISRGMHGLGFPLDDAWIHQTYARNFVDTGQWAFLPGEVSGGSTAPLWSFFLTPGYLLGIHPLMWTYLLGTAQLILIAWLGGRWVAQRRQRPESGFWPLALLLLFEWHLVWASVSGMETLSLALLALLIFTWLDSSRPPRSFWLGAAIGVGIWIRPEALLLGFSAALALAARKRPADIVKMIAGMGATGAPYLLFNLAIAGEIWPNTFFAKQAEYAVLRQAPLWLRIARMVGLPVNGQGVPTTEAGGPLVGVGALMLPGLFFDLRRVVRDKSWDQLAPYMWIGGVVAAYAWRLPATYQHGRYAIPIIPLGLALSYSGALEWIRRPAGALWRRVTQKAWVWSAAAVLAIFWLRGGLAYAQDVGVIETEMVQTAAWIEANTASDALVAAHDIGALGYFGDRRILDLAGLVSAEVVPFIRDEAQLERHMRREGAEYLVTFPGFYSSAFTRDLPIAYQTFSELSLQLGGENMVVFRLDS